MKFAQYFVNRKFVYHLKDIHSLVVVLNALSNNKVCVFIFRKLSSGCLRHLREPSSMGYKSVKKKKKKISGNIIGHKNLKRGYV